MPLPFSLGTPCASRGVIGGAAAGSITPDPNAACGRGVQRSFARLCAPTSLGVFRLLGGGLDRGPPRRGSSARPSPHRHRPDIAEFWLVSAAPEALPWKTGDAGEQSVLAAVFQASGLMDTARAAAIRTSEGDYRNMPWFRTSAPQKFWLLQHGAGSWFIGL